MLNCDKSRVSCIIKQGIQYERLTKFEDDDISTIWLKINLGKNKFVVIMAGYRQWTLPHTMGFPDSNNIDNQNARFDKIMNQIKNVRKNYRNAKICWDSNIDLLEGNDPCGRYDIKYMFDKYHEIMTDLNFHQMNHEATRHRNGQRSTLLDHCFSTNPGHIDNIETIVNHISDHSVVKWQYHCEELIFNPQFMKTRKYGDITRDAMHSYINTSERLNSVLAESCTNTVTNTVIEEYNIMINLIAPQHIIQIKKNHIPYANDELKEQSRDADEKLKDAIRTNEKEVWVEYKKLRNLLFKVIDKAKIGFYTNLIDKSKNVMKTVKHLTNNNESTIPKRIVDDTGIVTSPKCLSNIFNNHFIQKIKDINKTFTKSEVNPIDILELVIPKANTQFHLPEVTFEEVKDMIVKMKGTNSIGFDGLSSKIIKKIPEMTAVFVTHIINTSIREGTYPEILKVTRILPISKQGKSKYKKESYRPIANVHIFDKLYQEHIKRHLSNYLESNNLILPEHHGGRESHSTMTAKSILDYKMTNAIDEDKYCAVLSTDLSSAFDTVNLKILKEKLKHYGIKGNELCILNSFLEERTQYVEIDTKKSNLIKSLNNSVVQGSKLSSILYTIYTNEVPRLHTLLDNEAVMQQVALCNPVDISEVDHTVVNYVDDSNSSIKFNYKEDMKNYLQAYFHYY